VRAPVVGEPSKEVRPITHSHTLSHLNSHPHPHPHAHPHSTPTFAPRWNSTEFRPILLIGLLTLYHRCVLNPEESRWPCSPTNLRNFVETGYHFRMAKSRSLPVPIPARIARTKAFVWASRMRPIPARIAHTIAKWEPCRRKFVDARDCRGGVPTETVHRPRV